MHETPSSRSARGALSSVSGAGPASFRRALENLERVSGYGGSFCVVSLRGDRARNPILMSERSSRYASPRGWSGGPPASCRSPTIVRERLVGFRHLVRVVALLHRVSTVLRRVDQLGRQALAHRLFAAAARVRDQPAHGQG